MTKEKMQVKEILEKLESLSDPRAVKGMAKFGITPKRTYGVSIPVLRKMAREIGRDHKLALQLWDIEIREARILASMIDEPDLVTEEQMERWVKDFDCWEVCDQVCQNLFTSTRYAYKKAAEWTRREEEFVKRAGFALMAWLAFKDKRADDSEFEKFFDAIKIQKINSKTARWIVHFKLIHACAWCGQHSRCLSCSLHTVAGPADCRGYVVELHQELALPVVSRRGI